MRRVSSAAVKEAASTGPVTCVPAPRNVFSVAVVEISTSALNLLSGTIQAPVICLCTRTHTWACVHMCVTNIMGICKPKQGLDDLQAFGLNTREHQPSFSSGSWNQRSGMPLHPLRTEQLSEAPTGRPLGRAPFVGSESSPRALRRSPARGVLWEDDSNHVNVQTLPIFPIGYKQERTPCTRHKGSCKDTRGGRACVLLPS